MRASDLTEESVVVAFAPMALLPGAPVMTEALYGAVLGLFVGAGVTEAELRQAVVDVLSVEKFWPSPAVLIERVTENRKVELLARREAARKQQLLQLSEGGRQTGDTHYERQRQLMKKQLGLGEYRSGESMSRYGKEIEITESYVPPSLRKALTEDPDPQERGNGPRPMF